MCPVRLLTRAKVETIDKDFSLLFALQPRRIPAFLTSDLTFLVVYAPANSVFAFSSFSKYHLQ